MLEKLKLDNTKQQILDRHTALSHDQNSDNIHNVAILNMDGRGSRGDVEIKIIKHIVYENSPFLTYFSNWTEMAHKRQGDKYDKIIELFSKMGLLKELVAEYTPTYNLETSVIDLKKRYPMFTVMDWHEFGWSWREESSLTVFNYVNIIDITHHSVSKPKKTAKVSTSDQNDIANIFEEADKIEKKRKNDKELA